LFGVYGDEKKPFVDEVIYGKLEPLQYHQLNIKTKKNKKGI
jgi:hypothetical protein